MTTRIPVPTINANDDVVVIVRWHAADGAAVAADAPLVDVETTKAVSTVHAEQAGWVRHRCREGDEVAVGADLALIFSTQEELAAAPAAGPAGGDAAARIDSPSAGKSGAPSPPPSPSSAASPSLSSPAPSSFSSSSSSPARAAPGSAPALPSTPFTTTRLTQAAGRLAASLGLDLDALAQKKLGLITRPLLEAMFDPNPAGANHPGSASPSTAPAADGLRRERIPAGKRAEIDALRQGAGAHLNSSLSLYLDSAAVRARAAESGQGMLPLVLAELAPLLRQNPKFTAFVDGDSVAFHDAVHLGVAVDLGDGPKVVTLRDADRLDAAAIGEQLARMTLDYMERQLGVDALRGSTFTVTDLTGMDILHFQPLINGNQSAILGIGADSAMDGHPMTLTLVFDHRVLTGREVGELLNTLRSRILAHAGSPAAPARGPATVAAAAEATPLSGAGAERCCDFCLTDLKGYYEEFGQLPYAMMLQYVRKDGSTGLVCHRCQGGFL